MEIVLPTGAAGAQVGPGRKVVTEEYVQHVKSLVSQAGSLEFRILANTHDDAEAIRVAQEYLADPAHQAELDRLAREGEPPPPPPPPDGQSFRASKGDYTYSWVELGSQERHALNLDNAAEYDLSRNRLWQEMARDRGQHRSTLLRQEDSDFLLYSRPCEDLKLPANQRALKKYAYFVLTRSPPRDPLTNQPQPEITGQYLVNATVCADEHLRPDVHFRFDVTGGNLFRKLTSNNLPSGKSVSPFYRHLAIILDGEVMSAPTIQSAIGEDGQITGNFSRQEVDDLVTILRAGALPATLKPQPVSENSMGPTLGRDTIRAGALSVLIAFGVILLFMIVYYRFAGLVASLALMINLFLTVAFMVAFHATFTLPGLAGLVLMLAMAVDANVLIYDALREERERGAGLALAIRNGYDRSFPTIIDTHLSSIFTAVVLYIVGNDQLKGFGISLAVGLVISLFTSLYMTRVLFEIWLSRGWLHKLSMMKLFSRPNIDFMAIRYYWFTATILLTVLGLALFFHRGRRVLNIDFVGGTAYAGQLVKPASIETLREDLSERQQKERLTVKDIRQLDAEGRSFAITYTDGTTRTIDLPNQATAEAVRKRAEVLPDLSVEQIFLGPFTEEESNKSRFFLIRTSERAPELVQASVSRLLDGMLKKVEMTSYHIDPDNRGATLEFSDQAFPAQVSMILRREMKNQSLGEPAQQLQVMGSEPSGGQEGRFRQMRLTFSAPVNHQALVKALKATQTELGPRPQPERLENFDSQLAADTQSRALYAILASWGAVLLYLWFRFGSWTFGLAAVLCLIHDLCFTLGIIALCHYVYAWFPGAAQVLLLEDFKIDLPAVAALLTLVGYSVNDTIVVFDRIREVRGRDPKLAPQTINDSVNQTLSRTLLTAFATWLVVFVLYVWGGGGIHLFAFVMVVGVFVGTYSSIYIASPLLLLFGEGRRAVAVQSGDISAMESCSYLEER